MFWGFFLEIGIGGKVNLDAGGDSVRLLHPKLRQEKKRRRPIKRMIWSINDRWHTPYNLILCSPPAVLSISGSFN